MRAHGLGAPDYELVIRMQCSRAGTLPIVRGMRRRDIQLLALARQGDIGARCEVGRRYLLGIDGFPHHVASGLGYLTAPADAAAQARAACVIAESLALDEIVRLQQEPALVRAAEAGSAPAQLKLGVWTTLRQGRADAGERWLQRAAAAGQPIAARAAHALRATSIEPRAAAMLRVLGDAGLLDGAALAVLAAQQARDAGDLVQGVAGIATALALKPQVDAELAELIVAAVNLAEVQGALPGGLSPQAIEAALDQRAHRGDRDAAWLLGRALCGIDCGALPATSLVVGANLRKGVALLLRAADAGVEAAWLHLYRMHGDHKLSVANPQMARFCLEKAALGGQAEAQRKLGALLLRSADALPDTEAAIAWLHAASTQGDAHARVLLRSLVLPLEGDEVQAAVAIATVRRDDPWLAVRLQLARHYGLTKLEALCIDPVDGLRPWGIVVGKNPFISQIRLSAARAIPALGEAALEAARQAASLFGRARADGSGLEGDLRRRSLRQRRLFERHGLDEAMFFANATTTVLDALRLGPKWAFRAKEPLQLALAA